MALIIPFSVYTTLAKRPVIFIVNIKQQSKLKADISVSSIVIPVALNRDVLKRLKSKS